MAACLVVISRVIFTGFSPPLTGRRGGGGGLCVADKRRSFTACLSLMSLLSPSA